MKQVRGRGVEASGREHATSVIGGLSFLFLMLLGFVGYIGNAWASSSNGPVFMPGSGFPTPGCLGNTRQQAGVVGYTCGDSQDIHLGCAFLHRFFICAIIKRPL